MKNKPARKKTSSFVHRSKSSSEQTVLWYTVIVFSLILMVFANVGYKLSKPHVLGASTVLLAEGGSGSGGGSDSGSGESSFHESVSSAGSPVQVPTTGTTTTSGGESAPTQLNSISGDTMVDCIGPDGKQFVVNFQACHELNQQWGRARFSFTPLSGISSDGTSSAHNITLPTNSEKLKKYLTLQTEGKGKLVNVSTKGLHIEFTAEDNGTVSAVAQRDGGKDIKLSAHDALEKLNDQLKDQNVEIGSAEGGLAIKKGNVEAQTHFPLSVDPATGQLTVTTPAGTKTVAVLPDKAVQNLLVTGVFSGVSSQSSTASTGATEQTELTEINGMPAYQVQGVLSKKLLGLFPVSFSKTAFVSAQDGHTIEVQQSPFTSFLESLSF